MARNINDRIYVIDTTLCDDHFAVTVIPATVRRIVTTRELDTEGQPTETTQCMVAYDGESGRSTYHIVNEDNIVAIEPWTDSARKIGAAVLDAIEAQKAAEPPPVIESPPPAPQPAYPLNADGKEIPF